MKSRGSSKRWLAEHRRDPFVTKARSEGYRSRAAYKLREIAERDKLLKPGMTVVDLGAAPGGFSQVAAEQVATGKAPGRVLAVDLLPMEPLPNVTFIQGDFTEDETEQALIAALAGSPVDLVLSDMAPNLTGVRVVDEARSGLLVELAAETAFKILADDGGLVMKAFHGASATTVMKLLRTRFTRVVSRKPSASRAKSSEFYIVATGFRL